MSLTSDLSQNSEDLRFRFFPLDMKNNQITSYILVSPFVGKETLQKFLCQFFELLYYLHTRLLVSIKFLESSER